MSTGRHRNKRRYQRRLDVGSLVALLSLGVACAGVACGFVWVKNAHVARADAKWALEQEIRVLEKEMYSVSARITTSIDRASLSRALTRHGSKLVPIESSEIYTGSPGEIPVGIAAAIPSDGDITYINVDNPSG